MTRGIRVIWAGDDGRDDEVEYFCGIDVDELDRLPAISSVRAAWPREGTCVEYNVGAEYEHTEEGNVLFVVEYRAADNPELPDRDNIGWGTNTIVLTPGSREGCCSWMRSDATDPKEVRWQAFDLGEAHGRPRATYLRSRRYGQFRSIVLHCDERRCVITGEETVRALEAAHLVPARNGENDMPLNGIALRADLHRLFDARLFTFDTAGEVVVADRGTGMSDEYRRVLRGARLPPETFARVGATLALRQFRER